MIQSVLLLTIVCSLGIAQKKNEPQKKFNIAVLDFAAREGLSQGEAASLSDVFSSQMVSTGNFVVIDRNRIKELLVEQGFQQSEACSQTECIVEAGKILKVAKMFAGSIGKVGNTYSISVQMIDVGTAQIQINKARTYEGKVDALATDIIPELAAEMAQEITGKETEVIKTNRSSRAWIWYVAGGVALAGGAAAVLLKASNGGGTGGTTLEKIPPPPALP
jgi:TolB-like protein